MQDSVETRSPTDAMPGHTIDETDISVILPFHDEGRLAHRTLRGLELCLTFATEKGLCIETVIILDGVTDKILLQTVSQWIGKLGTCQVIRVDYGCPSPSRNYGISKSRGRFIAILDGDDLFCKDWLVKAFETCNATPGIIAHPELYYYFPLNKHLFVCQSMSEYRTLIHDNLWPALLMAPKSVFEKIPYRGADTEGFGHEDWLWNCETLADGFSHVVVPQTMMAIRQKPAADSRCQETTMNNRVVAPNSLFRTILCEPYYQSKRSASYEPTNSVTAPKFGGSISPLITAENSHAQKTETSSVARETNEDRLENFSRWLKSILLSRRLRFIRDQISPRYRHALKEIMRHARQMMLIALGLMKSGGSASPEIGFPWETPSWLRDKILALAKIEPEVGFFGPLRRSIPKSRIYKHITPSMGAFIEARKPRAFILPWLIKGGADLVAIHYMNVVQENVFLITTQEADNALSKYVPPGAVHIDIGNTDLSYDERLILLHRLLLEADCEFIHTINSREAFDIFVKYRSTLEDRCMFASFFCTEIVQGFDAGYAVEYFPSLMDFFERISTDNRSFKKRLEELYGIPDDLIVAHRMPFSSRHHNMIGDNANLSDNWAGSKENGFLRVFFAGRLAPQKRPEIAIQAVEALLLEGKRVSLDVWGAPYGNFSLDDSDRPEIRLRGAFDGLASLRPTQYDVMILPSEFEGLPNVLIECMGNGIPVIASNVGGVSEIVTNETGWLVNDHHNPRAFQEILRVLLDDKQAIRKKGMAARQFVAEHHSWTAFQAQVKDFYWH